MRIEVTNLIKRYGDRKVLTGVNLTVTAGETVNVDLTRPVSTQGNAFRTYRGLLSGKHA